MDETNILADRFKTVCDSSIVSIVNNRKHIRLSGTGASHIDAATLSLIAIILCHVTCMLDKDHLTLIFLASDRVE